MQTNERVIFTMSAVDRNRAVRETQNALRLAAVADAVASSVRGSLASASRAMTLVYGRSR